MNHARPRLCTTPFLRRGKLTQLSLSLSANERRMLELLATSLVLCLFLVEMNARLPRVARASFMSSCRPIDQIGVVVYTTSICPSNEDNPIQKKVSMIVNTQYGRHSIAPVSRLQCGCQTGWGSMSCKAAW
jgi:hypothetical protein